MSLMFCWQLGSFSETTQAYTSRISSEHHCGSSYFCYPKGFRDMRLLLAVKIMSRRNIFIYIYIYGIYAKREKKSRGLKRWGKGGGRKRKN